MNRLIIVLVISGAICLAYFISLQKVAAFTKTEENLIMQGVLAEWTKQCEQEYVGSTYSRIPKSTSLSICGSIKGQLGEIKQASEISRFCSRAAGCCSEFLEATSNKMTLQEFMTNGTRTNQESRCDISQ